MKHRAPQFELPLPDEPFRLVAEALPVLEVMAAITKPQPQPEVLPFPEFKEVNPDFEGWEMGYISLPELLANGAELNFHYHPKTS